MSSPATLFEDYLRRTPGSAELYRQAQCVLPSGIAHDSRHLAPHPVYVARASGSRKWDVDGNEYVDYSGGHGALLLGHNHPAVTQAVADQLTRGTHFGACHESEVRWAAMVEDLVPSAELVRFTSSGTEATLLALRLARAYTGRTKVIRFAGHFHGWHDHVAFGVSGQFNGGVSPGVLPELGQAVLLLPPGDESAVDAALATHADVAAIIVEPTGASWGQAPIAPRFLHHLRQVASTHGALLIFDEVISGFRCSPGGAQEVLGILPDLTTLAKILAGGLPGGAVVGRGDVMQALAFPGPEEAPREKIPHHGTFNANPLSAAAGIAALGIVAETDVCSRASEYADALREALRKEVRDAGLDWVVYGTFSGFHIFTNPQHLPLSVEEIEAGRVDYRELKGADKRLSGRLRLAMLLGGVEIFSWPGGPTSAVHTPADLEQTAVAFREAISRLRREGDLE